MRKPTSQLWIIAWGLAVIVATLLPPDFEEAATGREMFHVSPSEFLDVLDVVLNVLLFVPLGVLLLLTLRPHGWTVRPVSAIAAGCGLLFSFGIEFLQQFSLSRSASYVDVVMNTLGAVAGVYCCDVLGQKLTSQLATLCRNGTAFTRAAMLAGVTLAVLTFSGVVQRASSPNNWDERYYLMIGNEYTGDRPWRGRLYRADLSDWSVPADALRTFTAGSAAGVGLGNLASFDFSGPGGLRQTRAIPSLIWVGPAQGLSHGAPVTNGSWLQTEQPPAEIARRIRVSSRFTLRLLCKTDDPNQEGPARILSYSINPMLRNLMVGQEGQDMVVRVRTPIMGANGSRIPLVVPGVFSDHRVRDIVISYDGSALWMAIAGTNNVRVIEFDPGMSLASFYLPEERARYFKPVYYGSVFLIVLWLLAWLTPGMRSYLWIGVALVILLAAALEIVLMLAGSRPASPSNFLMSLAIGAGLLLALGTMGKSRRTVNRVADRQFRET